MATGRVLIIEQDEWEAALLSKFLREAGHEVDVQVEARAGFERVRQTEPDCILCAVSLPDIDGFWVARRVRAEPSRVRATPFLFLSDAEEPEGRLQALNVGADLLLVKPIRAEEVVAQVSALIDMANRLKASSSDGLDGPPSSARPMAFQGDLAQMSVSTVLTLLELERQSGRLKIKRDASETATFEICEGAFARASFEEAACDVVELLRRVLHWKSGRFHFRSTHIALDGERDSVSSLLLRAMQLEDEAHKS